MKPLSIVHVASEMAPLAKVGGLADVVGALAVEQARRGHRVTVVLPAYQSVAMPAGWIRRAFANGRVPWGPWSEPARWDLAERPARRRTNGIARPETGTVLDAGGDAGTLRVLLVEHEGDRRFFDRPGLYDDPRTGEGYPDNAERYLFFARAAVEGLKHFGERFDVLHAHDQQGAWTTCFVRTHDAFESAFLGLATVFTIHNLGYQGIHDPWVLGLAGFGGELFYPASPFEYWGRVNTMKIGLAFTDLITTVSPRYAKEIQSSGEFGYGLEGVLKHRTADVRGILNGIDDEYWDPARDPYLPAHYSLADLSGKRECRRALIEECGWPRSPDWPIVGIVSRLVEQKGFDLIERAQRELREVDARLVVLGSGPPRYQDLIWRLSHEHPERVYHRAGYDERFAHLIEAGSDLFLMPSRYEPCGLNQMYSQRYGTVPVVRAVGGLADTVEEFDPVHGTGTGFTFARFDHHEMLGALRRALATLKQPALWSRLVENGMKRDFSWRRAAEAYDALYLEARARVAEHGAPSLREVREMMRAG